MKLEPIYRLVCHFLMALASTSLLPAIYLIKSKYRIFQMESECHNWILDFLFYIGIPILISLLSLWWMKSQSDDSINKEVTEITPVNHEYLPVYLGYIFVSLSMPNPYDGQADWKLLIIIYLFISLFVTCSKTLCFNPIFIVFGYGYYQITTSNGVKVFVMTRKTIRKASTNLTFPNLKKVNELVYVDTEVDN